MADTTMRKNSTVKWSEDGTEYIGRYTSSNYETYFLKNVYEIIYNINHGIHCYYFPKRYKEKRYLKKKTKEKV